MNSRQEIHEALNYNQFRQIILKLRLRNLRNGNGHPEDTEPDIQTTLDQVKRQRRLLLSQLMGGLERQGGAE